MPGRFFQLILNDEENGCFFVFRHQRNDGRLKAHWIAKPLIVQSTESKKSDQQFDAICKKFNSVPSSKKKKPIMRTECFMDSGLNSLQTACIVSRRKLSSCNRKGGQVLTCDPQNSPKLGTYPHLFTLMYKVAYLSIETRQSLDKRYGYHLKRRHTNFRLHIQMAQLPL